MKIEITPEMIRAARTKGGGFTKKQVLLAKKLTGSDSGFAKALRNTEIEQRDWDRFCAMSGIKSRPANYKQTKDLEKEVVKLKNRIKELEEIIRITATRMK